MKVFLRYLSVALAILMLLGMFTACKKDEEPQPSDTIQTDGTTDDEKTDDEKTDDGKTDDGKTDDGKTDDGAGDEKENKNIDANVVSMKSFDTTLMSFNILNDSTYEARWDEVASFIMRSEGSIICMQEVKKEQFDFLKEELAEKYNVVWYPRESDTSEGLATAYAKDEWTLVNEERFWLSETPDVKSKGWGASYYRICVRTLLEHKATGSKLDVFNVHLDFNQANLEGARLVIERAKQSEYPVYVGGDFNTRYTMDTTYVELAAAFQDCQQVAHDTDLGITGHEKFKYGDYEGVPIDYCFLTRDVFDVLVFDVCRDRRTDNNSWLSDHYPIKATVRYIYEYEVNYPDTTPGGFDGDMAV